MAHTTSIDPAEIVRTTIQSAFAGDLAALDAHPGMEALRSHFPAFKAAFPDIKAEIQQQIVDGDRVATHWIFSGTHQGTFYGIPATGKPVRFQNVSIARVKDGRVVAYNSETGWLTMLTQIGAFPVRDGRIGTATA